MIAFITYTMQIVMAFLMLTMVSIMLPRAGVAATRIEEVLDTEPSIHDAEETKGNEKEFSGVLEFHDVGFAYDGAKEEALSDISFTGNNRDHRKYRMWKDHIIKSDPAFL